MTGFQRICRAIVILISAVCVVAAGSVAASAAPVAPASCTGIAYSPPSPPFNKYGSPGKAHCGIGGEPGHRVTYTFIVGGNAGMGAVQLLGYNSKMKATWYGVGAYASGEGAKASVPWGNVMATPELRVAGSGPGVVVQFGAA